jgi:uncharacterized membrane protein
MQSKLPQPPRTRAALHGSSIGPAALTVLEAVVLVLMWHEYRVVRAATS